MTLPASVTNATGGGKIVTLPVTNVGKTGSGLDVKTTLPVNRVTDLPSTQRQQIKTNGPAVLKLNNNPPMGNNRPQGNIQGNTLPGKVSGGFTVNNSANNNAASRRCSRSPVVRRSRWAKCAAGSDGIAQRQQNRGRACALPRSIF